MDALCSFADIHWPSIYGTTDPHNLPGCKLLQTDGSGRHSAVVIVGICHLLMVVWDCLSVAVENMCVVEVFLNSGYLNSNILNPKMKLIT
jgi:hypothetical protein